ncbi:MAG: EAL domain-containing protein [Notoacmeibacter sp.]
MKLADLHIRRQEDGTYAAVWGPFMLKTGFQPIFRMKAGSTRINAFEALCRPFRNGAASSPGQFFPMVPRNESYRVELQTRAVHVLNAPSVLTDREWLFLNFDPSMFTSKSEVEIALDILDETLKISDMDRRRIVCEVTEHKTDESNLLLLVNQLRNRGFRIAVDDYGADSSDMERVRKLSPDIIKFDAYWITRLMDSGVAGADLLREMVESFKQRGILTLFEGIEHGWQLDLAVECGVEFVQGYVLARPQTVPLNFHDFRAKQDMNVTLRELHASDVVRAGMSNVPMAADDGANKVRPSAFNAWEQEISAAMDSPDVANPRLKNDLPIEIDRMPKPDRVSFAAPAAQVYTPPKDIRQGSFTPAFGVRGATFGQRR